MVLCGILVMAWLGVNRLAWASLSPHTGPQPAPPEGLSRVHAADCAGCHPEAFRQWQHSAMGQSMANPGFLQDWRSQGELPICLACHAPFQDQQPLRVDGVWAVVPWLVLDSQPHPGFDPSLQEEGVTCLACHLDDDGFVATGPDVEPPHASREAPDLGMVCVRCHQMVTSVLDGLPRPIIDTANEHTRWQQATGRTESCADCHLRRDGHVRHDLHGGTSERLVAQGLRAALTPSARGWELTVTNTAGHHVPTGETSGAIDLVVEASGQAPRRLQRLTRTITGPPWRESADTTLRPTEARTWQLDDAAGYRVLARVERLIHLPEARRASAAAGRTVTVDVVLAEAQR